MAWRMALDRREADQRRLVREQSAAFMQAAPSSENLAVSAERSARLWEVIDSLSEKLRLAVVLNAIEGHDVAEVASILGIPEGTVKSRLFDARQQMRERLK
jgi:RNA polymerase sigma-70 factor (ECF subfamily)